MLFHRPARQLETIRAYFEMNYNGFYIAHCGWVAQRREFVGEKILKRSRAHLHSAHELKRKENPSSRRTLTVYTPVAKLWK
jgi:hypothetical protein